VAGRNPASPAQKERFWNLVNESGMNARQAAVQVGMSKQWGYRMLQGLDGISAKNPTDLERRMQAAAPDPKPLDKLTPAVRAMLAPEGFNDFCEQFLRRRPAPWRQHAASRVVDMLTDRTEKSYCVVNTPPGAGKSTLFTLDIPLWLICGGGFEDPLAGRAIRILLGHESKKVSIDYVRRLRRMLELRRPYYDKEQHHTAALVLTNEFGRFKPVIAEGEESIWAQEQFLVAQLEVVDLYEKEPTVQAASKQSGFLGERVDFYSWDDLVTSKTSRDPVQADSLDVWFENEAETRLEPGGVGLLVGQRLGPLDLYRKRLDQTWVDEATNEVHLKYHHIVYPAHHEITCDGIHRQWDTELEGCLLDDYRLPWREIQKIRANPNFRTVYQQEDSDPGAALVLPVWIDGGIDPSGFSAPGCWDKERGFYEFPPGLGDKSKWICYVCVDPSASQWWAVEWWATYPVAGMKFTDWPRYLIWGKRAKLQAGGPGGFLDWDATTSKHVGIMEDVQQRSIAMETPIRVWIIEANAAQRHILQYDHFKRWRAKYPFVKIIPHQTQRNKEDPVLGVEGAMRMVYRNGQKHLPRSPSSPDALNYTKHKVQELTTYPLAATNDTVMADWFGETNFSTIVRMGLNPMNEIHQVVPGFHAPPYLQRQYASVQLHR
jgi:hypothetical protein